MDRHWVLEPVERLSSLDIATLDYPAALAMLETSRKVQSWAAGRSAALRRRVTETSSSPSVGRADADEVTTSSQSSGNRDEVRANTTGAVPEVQDALDMGDITVEHVDVIGAALASLEPEEQLLLAHMGRDLVEQAMGVNPDHYRANLRMLIDRLRQDAGQGLLERQQRATQLAVWLDKDTGMWCLNGRLDPELAATISQQLDAALRVRLVHKAPRLCPSDPQAKVKWARAHALGDVFAAALGGGGGGGGGGSGGGARAEVTIVVTSPQGHVDTGLDHAGCGEFVIDLIRRGVATLYTVITHDGQVIEAPGRLNLGRLTRIANRAQRRALHALYPTCAIPGCTVDYRLCRLHHVQWWRHGGPTDLGNLLPVCDHHHRAIHDDGWTIVLGPNRQLTVTRPDGKTMSTGPPGRGP